MKSVSQNIFWDLVHVLIRSNDFQPWLLYFIIIKIVQADDTNDELHTSVILCKGCSEENVQLIQGYF